MKKVCIILVLINIIHSTSNAWGEETLTLITGEWPPYTSQKIEDQGVITAVVTAIVKEMGMKVEYMWMPWERGNMMIRKGDAFAQFPNARTETRAKNSDFSEPFFYTRTVFFYSRGRMKKPSYVTLEDLRPYKIGGVIGYGYMPNFKKAGLNVYGIIKDIQLVQMLYLGRLDLAPLDEYGGWLEINKLYPNEVDQFGILDKPLYSTLESASHLMISRKYPGNERLRNQFNLALQRTKEKGIYQAVLRKFNYNMPETGTEEDDMKLENKKMRRIFYRRYFYDDLRWSKIHIFSKLD